VWRTDDVRSWDWDECAGLIYLMLRFCESDELETSCDAMHAIIAKLAIYLSAFGLCEIVSQSKTRGFGYYSRMEISTVLYCQ
jgi:hypothetical protein